MYPSQDNTASVERNVSRCVEAEGALGKGVKIVPEDFDGGEGLL
jgi:hypothetical protein